MPLGLQTFHYIVPIGNHCISAQTPLGLHPFIGVHCIYAQMPLGLQPVHIIILRYGTNAFPLKCRSGSRHSIRSFLGIFWGPLKLLSVHFISAQMPLGLKSIIRGPFNFRSVIGGCSLTLFGRWVCSLTSFGRWVCSLTSFGHWGCSLTLFGRWGCSLTLFGHWVSSLASLGRSILL